MGGLISVIVPNRDGADVIGPCLRSVLAQDWPAVELIVVDDGSTDGSAELVAREFPAARLVRVRWPVGFAGACCAGLSASTGEWVAVLNSDAEAEPGWLSAALAAAGSAPDAAMVACRVLSADGATVDSLGLRLTAGGLSLLRAHGESAAGPAVETEEVFGPAGSAALYRRDALNTVGFFAPDFFAYYEDTDLAWRLRLAGGRCVLAHRAVVRHRHSHTAARVGLDKRYWLHVNRLRTVARNWPGPLIWRNLHRIVAVDLASCGLALLELHPFSALSARLHFLLSLPADLRGRRGRAADPRAAEWIGRDALPAGGAP